jgi:parvulin-like peptidyl-prolyl isomerase
MRLALLARRIKAKRLATAETEVAPAQIAAYYQANRSRMVIPERRYFEILMTHDRARALAARREVEAGRDFLAVARRAGFDPEAPHGLQALSPGEEEPEFRRVVFHAKPHRLVGPVAQSVDYYVMRLLAIRRPRVEALSSGRGGIRRTLAGRLLAGRIEPQAGRRWATRMTCARGRLMRACRRAVASGV